MKNKKMAVTISIDGLVGAGKSTVMSLMEEKRKEEKMNFIYEPVEDFCCYKNKCQTKTFNPLQEAYKHPQTVAPITQVHFVDCIARHFEKNFEVGGVNITERFCFSPIVFVNTNVDLQNFNCFVQEFLWDYTFSKISSHFAPHLVLFLDVPIHQTLKRIQNRQREGEECITQEFQSALRKNYLDFFEKSQLNMVNIPVSPDETVFETEDKVWQEVVKFLKMEKIIQSEVKLTSCSC